MNIVSQSELLSALSLASLLKVTPQQKEKKLKTETVKGLYGEQNKYVKVSLIELQTELT